jgi:PAS domain S-box-containing protein
MRLTGYTGAELLGKKCALLHGPETDRGTLETLRNALRGDGYFEGEILNYRKDGTTFWNALSVSPVRDEHGELRGFLGIQRDISQRKAAEAALRESEEHLRTIIGLEPECVKLISREGKVLEMNPAGLAMIEADSIEKARGLDVADLVVPEERERYVVLHRRAVNGETVRGEFAVKCLRGTQRWVETHAVPYRDAKGEIVGVLAITHDITQSKEAAAELERSFSTLQLFIDTVPAYIAFVDLEERYRWVNVRYEELIGLPRAELLGLRVSDLHPPAAYAVAEPHVRAALEGRRARFQLNRLTPDGKSRWLDVQLVPSHSPDGAVLGFFSLVFDITEKKTAEDALLESERRYRQLFEANPHPMWVYEIATLRFLAVNNAAIAHYGYSRDEFLAMTLKDIRPPEDIPALLASVEAASEGFAEAGVWRHRKRDGTLIDVEISSHVIDFAGYRAHVALAHDVTERRRSEARLLQAEDAERRRIAKELHDSTAQDLVAVIMNLGTLQDSLAREDTKAARIIEDSIALVENSVNDIRTLSYVLHPPRLDELGLVGGISEYAAGVTTRTDTRIRLLAAPDFGRLPDEMEIVLFRVVQEGIANILRHSGSDTAAIRLARHDGNVVLEIEDNGRGMADARVRGVGIAGMNERLQQLGGRLEIESDNAGTLVRAVIPLRGNRK